MTHQNEVTGNHDFAYLSAAESRTNQTSSWFSQDGGRGPPAPTRGTLGPNSLFPEGDLRQQSQIVQKVPLIGRLVQEALVTEFPSRPSMKVL